MSNRPNICLREVIPDKQQRLVQMFAERIGDQIRPVVSPSSARMASVSAPMMVIGLPRSSGSARCTHNTAGGLPLQEMAGKVAKEKSPRDEISCAQSAKAPSRVSAEEQKG